MHASGVVIQCSAWNVVPSPNPGRKVAPSQLYSVATISKSDAWAVGSAGNGTLIEHWDGAKWNIVPGPAPRSGQYSVGLFGVASIAGTSQLIAVGAHDPFAHFTRTTLIEQYC